MQTLLNLRRYKPGKPHAKVKVQFADGSTVEAETYVFRAEFADLLRPGDWDFDDFLRHGRAAFEARYVGYARI